MNSNLFHLPDNGWRPLLAEQLGQSYGQALAAFLAQEAAGNVICPDQSDWFRAFQDTPPESVRVCIIGQDPYFNGEAMGLSFSVKPGFKLTPSVRNILKEVTGLADVKHYAGNLEGWAKQGVLMLNTCLTTRVGQAGAHANQGWEKLTLSVIDHLNQHQTPIVFLAWGRWAHKVVDRIDGNTHYVIKTSHPSPLGARKQGKDFAAFLGSGCFNKANRFLQDNDFEPIQWQESLQLTHDTLLPEVDAQTNSSTTKTV